MLPRLKIPGWLSSVKTVALKRENTQLMEIRGAFATNSAENGKKSPAGEELGGEMGRWEVE